MKDWKQIAVSPETPIRNVLAIIDQGALQIALVVDENDRLMGTVTDGDVRRGILRGVDLDEPVRRVFNENSVTVSVDDDVTFIQRLMKDKYARQIPMLDHDGRVVRLYLLKDFLREDKRDIPVLLMAGGLGTRLKPLTDDCPKPLLRIGGRPILEIILENFIEHGFRQFYFSVNYKAKMIEDYFGDGSRWGATIEYLREKKKMGTAGALSLIPEQPTVPIIVMNGDLLTKVNFQHLLAFHKENENPATICVSEYGFRVPFGVVQVENNRLIGLREKPEHKFFVNAGIYILEPEVLNLIPKNEFFDMTSLFEELILRNNDVAVFPLREYWLDVGRLGDYEQAKDEYHNME